MFKFKSIQARILTFTGFCLLLTAAAIIAYAAVSLRQTATRAAEARMMAAAQSHAASIKARIEVAQDIARTLAAECTAMKSQGLSISREDINGLLKQILIENPDFLGVYVLWEPNAFDGLDAEYINKAGSSETGRYVPYWNRGVEGRLTLEPVIESDMAVSDYYQIPKKTRNEAIIEPYAYPMQGVDVYMTSVVAPIVVEDEFYGIAGVDFKLDFLQQFVDTAETYEDEEVIVLITYGGKLAGVRGLAELVREEAGRSSKHNLYPDWEQTNKLRRIQGGETFYEYQDNALKVFAPIHFGKTTTPWAVSGIVPTKVITREATDLMWQLIAIGVLFAVIGLVILWMAAGQIAAPVKRLTTVAQVIATGNLSQEVQEKQQDEVGKMAQAFGEMTANLRLMVGQVQRNATEVAMAAQQINATSEQSAVATGQVALAMQQIARGAAQQSDRMNQTTDMVQQVSHAIEGVARGAQEQSMAVTQASDVTARISKTIGEVVANARAGAEDAARAAQTAQAGAHTIEATIQGMQTIKKTQDEARLKVTEMGARAEEIGMIVVAIEKIADQTNLLALNAAIEAARAGEHGKGFAVVADEVRRLAENAGNATQEVVALVKGIQKSVIEAVKAMEVGAVEVDSGVTRSQEAGRALNEILSAVNLVNRQMTDITHNAQQMNQAAQEMVNAVETVSAVVEENTAATEEMASSAEEVLGSIEEAAGITEENNASVEQVSASVEEVSAQAEEVTASAETLREMAQELNALVTRFKLEES